MFEQLLQQNRLNISCEVACMVRDHANFLDQYESINLACGAYIASSAVNAKLLRQGREYQLWKFHHYGFSRRICADAGRYV